MLAKIIVLLVGIVMTYWGTKSCFTMELPDNPSFMLVPPCCVVAGIYLIYYGWYLPVG